MTVRAARSGVECLTCKVQARDSAVVRALERQGFLLMDTLLDLVFDSSRTPLENIRLPNRPERLRTRLATPEDPPEILAARPRSVCELFWPLSLGPQNAARDRCKGLRSMGVFRFRGLGGLDSCGRDRW